MNRSLSETLLSPQKYRSLTQCAYHMSSAQVQSALRPFVARVHPDRLSGKYPALAVQNERSLQALNGYIQDVTNGTSTKATVLNFHLLESTPQKTNTKQITLCLNGTDINNLIRLLFSSFDNKTLLITFRNALIAVDQPTNTIPHVPRSTTPRMPWPCDLTTDLTPFLRRKSFEAWRRFGTAEAAQQRVEEKRRAAAVFTYTRANAKLIEQRQERWPLEEQQLNEKAAELTAQMHLTSLSFDVNLSKNISLVHSTRASLKSLQRLYESFVDNDRGRVLLSSLAGQRLRLSSDATRVEIDGTVNLSVNDSPERWVTLWPLAHNSQATQRQIDKLRVAIKQRLCGIGHLRAAEVHRLSLQAYSILLRQLAANLSIDTNTMPQREQFTVNERCLAHNTPHCNVNEGLDLLICDALGTTSVAHDGAIVLCATENQVHKALSRMKPIAINTMRRHALNVDVVETLRREVQCKLGVARLSLCPQLELRHIIDCLSRWSASIPSRSFINDGLPPSTRLHISLTASIHADGTVQIPHTVDL